MQDRAKSQSASGTESGRKLLSVLMCFSGARPTWSVADLASELGLTPSSAYRYVGQLRESGLLEAGPGGSYNVTDRVLRLAEANDATRSALVDLALPVMTALRDFSGETVLLARRAGEHAFCVERVESRQAVRLQFDPGQAMALHSGSMSRLLLANMPVSERRRYLEKVMPAVAPNHRVLLSEEALDRVARVGHNESMEEIDEGIWGTAAALTRGREVVAVIGLAGPVYRLDANRRAQIRREVTKAATEISAQLDPAWRANRS